MAVRTIYAFQMRQPSRHGLGLLACQFPQTAVVSLANRDAFAIAVLTWNEANKRAQQLRDDGLRLRPEPSAD